jgi:ATP-dependent RNA helicase RhlE
MKFALLGLAEPILRAVTDEGYITATPIQAQAIPHVIEGRDVLGCAQTGTGKTAAFALPILHRLAATNGHAKAHAPAAHAKGNGHSGNGHAAGARRPIRCLVLSPTRELAVQIGDSFRAYGRHVGLRHSVIFGGVGQGPQTSALRAGVDVLVATPGRLLDLMNQGFVDLRHVEVFVLDEGDRMLDMGFINDIRKIITKLPHKRQNLMFSATMPEPIRALANTILHNPVSVQVTPVSSTAERVEQSVYMVEKRNKPYLLAHLLGSIGYSRVLVFTRTKHGADRVVRQLHRAGIASEAIHGNKSQNARQRALQNFKTGKTPVLIASDIAARGIDIDEISHVVNYDLPNEPETYVHRIGRTARAGAAGSAIAFCDKDERSYLRQIERLIRASIDVRDDQPEYPAHEPQRHEYASDERRQPSSHGPRQQHSQPRPSRHSNRPATSHGGSSHGGSSHGGSRGSSTGHSHSRPTTGNAPRHPSRHAGSTGRGRSRRR